MAYQINRYNSKQMVEPTLRTSADDLYDLVKAQKRITIDEAAKKLNAPLDVIRALVDFLVEEKIFGIEYKFTTPYIYISKETDKISLEHDKGDGLISKEEFFEKAQKRNMPVEKIHDLWHRYLNQNLDTIKKEFYLRSMQKNIPRTHIDALWNKYLSYIR